MRLASGGKVKGILLLQINPSKKKRQEIKQRIVRVDNIHYFSLYLIQILLVGFVAEVK